MHVPPRTRAPHPPTHNHTHIHTHTHARATLPKRLERALPRSLPTGARSPPTAAAGAIIARVATWLAPSVAHTTRTRGDGGRGEKGTVQAAWGQHLGTARSGVVHAQ
eukprot:1546851-Prymnesium_polylepis.1